MKRITKRLRNQRGETLAETLVALLISAVAVMMLAGAINASVRLITRSSDKLSEYYKDDEYIATQQGTGSANTQNGSLYAVFTAGADGIQLSLEKASVAGSPSVALKYYENDGFGGKPVVSYVVTTETGGGEP